MDKTEKEQVVFTLLGIFPNYTQYFNHFMEIRQYDLTKTQFKIILSLGCCPGMTMGELADKICISRELASRAVGPLVDRNLIVRSINCRNRRQINMNLTLHGEQYLSEIKRGYADIMLSSLDCLSEEELENFLHCLNYMEEILNKITAK
jgi:DNA-binding MarR family transcriptional regulator